MHLCLFEDDAVAHLRPMVSTRAVYDLRLGIRTLLETTREAFDASGTFLHARSLVEQVTAQENDLLAGRIPEGLDVLFVNGRFIAEEGPALERIRAAVDNGEAARAFVQDGTLVAAWVPEADARFNRLVGQNAITRADFPDIREEEVSEARFISRLWELLGELRPALERDYAARVDHDIYERPGAEVYDGAQIIAGERVYLGAGTTVKPGAVLNAEEGPIYIEENVTVDEGAIIRGPFYAGRNVQIKTEANIDCSAFGYYCKVSGQVEDSMLHSLSNKAHSGFLGHAYLGRWCNIGADTNNSDLKNDYGEVELYDSVTGEFEATGRQFLGLFMGDHSKCGINTMFNTGTVVGVSCNLYGAGYMPRHVPSFSWGSPAGGFTEYRLDKALRVAEAVMGRRDTPLTDADREMLTEVFEANPEAHGQVTA